MWFENYSCFLGGISNSHFLQVSISFSSNFSTIFPRRVHNLLYRAGSRAGERGHPRKFGRVDSPLSPSWRSTYQNDSCDCSGRDHVTQKILENRQLSKSISPNIRNNGFALEKRPFRSRTDSDMCCKLQLFFFASCSYHLRHNLKFFHHLQKLLLSGSIKESQDRLPSPVHPNINLGLNSFPLFGG